MDADRLMVLKFYDLIFGIVLIVVSLVFSYIIASMIKIEANTPVVTSVEILSLNPSSGQ